MKRAGFAFVGVCAVFVWGAVVLARIDNARLNRTIANVVANNPTPTACELSAINTRSAAIASEVRYIGDDLIVEVVP